MERTRLNKFIAHRYGLSRREADERIMGGFVYVNGKQAIIGTIVDAANDVVEIKGMKTVDEQEYIYLALNKPVGYVCSRRRQGDTPTIYELLPEKYTALKPVGRLDKDSSGILLLTNDGDLAHQMTHPKFHKTKTYAVSLDRALEPLHRQMISDIGITLEDGVSKLQLDRAVDGNDTSWILSMHEGRNRQIRRTFSALGYAVIKLHRTTFGPYSLGALRDGGFEEISIKK